MTNSLDGEDYDDGVFFRLRMRKLKKYDDDYDFGDDATGIVMNTVTVSYDIGQ